jgi:hypothetical protein
LRKIQEILESEANLTISIEVGILTIYRIEYCPLLPSSFRNCYIDRLHRRARELHLQGSILVNNGHLTCSTGGSGIQARIENPVFELRERVSPDIIDKGIEWLSIKAFFGLHEREVTVQDDGVNQRVVVETGESLGIKDYHDLWRLLKEAFRTPFVCSDYQIVVQGCRVTSLETPQDLVSLLSSLDKTLNSVKYQAGQ